MNPFEGLILQISSKSETDHVSLLPGILRHGQLRVTLGANQADLENGLRGVLSDRNETYTRRYLDSV